MSYRIEYGSPQKKRIYGLLRLPVLTALSFLLFLLLVNLFWTDGAELICSAIADIRSETADVLNTLEQDFLSGESLTAVFSDYIRSFEP